MTYTRPHTRLRGILLHTLGVSAACGLILGTASLACAQTAAPQTAPDCAETDALLKDLTNKIRLLETERQSLKAAPLTSFPELKPTGSMDEGKELRSSKYQIEVLEKENADLRARINELETERSKIPPVNLDDITDPGEKEAMKRDLAEKAKKKSGEQKEELPVPPPPSPVKEDGKVLPAQKPQEDRSAPKPAADEDAQDKELAKPQAEKTPSPPAAKLAPAPVTPAPAPLKAKDPKEKEPAPALAPKAQPPQAPAKATPPVASPTPPEAVKPASPSLPPPASKPSAPAVPAPESKTAPAPQTQNGVTPPANSPASKPQAAPQTSTQPQQGSFALPPPVPEAPTLPGFMKPAAPDSPAKVSRPSPAAAKTAPAAKPQTTATKAATISSTQTPAAKPAVAPTVKTTAAPVPVKTTTSAAPTAAPSPTSTGSSAAYPAPIALPPPIPPISSERDM